MLFKTECNRALFHLHLQNVPVHCLVVDTYTSFLPAAQCLQNSLNSVTSHALTTIASISGGLNCNGLISNNQRGAGNLCRWVGPSLSDEIFCNPPICA